jgi:regulator of sigma E protease
MKNVDGGIMMVDSLGYELGLKTGDKLVAANNKPFVLFDDFQASFILEEVKDIEISRNDSTIHLNVPAGFTSKVAQLKSAPMVVPRFAAIVNNPYTKEAKTAGFLKGDKILGINDKSVLFFEDLAPALDSLKNITAAVKVLRNGKEVVLQVKVNENGKLGLQLEQDPLKVFKIERTSYNIFQALPLGIKETFTTLGKYVKGIGTLFKSKEHKLKDSVGGFGTMISVFPETLDWEQFWYLTAFISVALAFMNILPIPMLDGGYVLFLMYEMIFRRPLPEKVQNVLQNFGLIFILGLLLITNGLDVAKSEWLNNLIHFFQNLFK